MAPTLALPNFLARWPFQPIENPHHDADFAAASRQWVEDFKIFDTKAQEKHNKANISLLASLTYPKLDPIHLRGASELCNWLFIVDDTTDGLDAESARELAARLMDVFRDPLKTHDGQTALEKLTASFWSRCLEYAHPVSAKRFVNSLRPYFEAFCQEAEDRDHHRLEPMDEFLKLRRNTSGVRVTFNFLVLSKHLPDEVIDHPLIESLTVCAIDTIILSNDIISFNDERSRGQDGHNMLSVVMAEKGLDLQGAVDYVAELYYNETEKFLDGSTNVPSFGETIDPVLSEYIFGLGNWLTGYIEWSFVTERYFGVGACNMRNNGVLEVVPSKLGELSSTAA